jgi:putative membrane protein
MLTEPIVAYLHFISVLAVAAVLAAELLLYRRGLTAGTARLLQRIDGVYGIAAVGVAATGFLRVFWVGKGAALYTGNPVFHALWALFLAVGLLSILPTVQFIRWGKGPAQGQAPAIPEAAFQRVRRAILMEVHLLAVLPLLAVLMARGIGG